MARYAVIEDDEVTNIVVCEDEKFARDQGWVQLGQATFGWKLRDGQLMSQEDFVASKRQQGKDKKDK